MPPSPCSALRVRPAAVPCPPRRPSPAAAAAPCRRARRAPASGPRAAAATPPPPASPEPSMSEAQALAAKDALIDAMLSASASAEGEAALAEVVRSNVLAVDVAFYLRLAARSDSVGEAEREALAGLASRVMVLVDAVVVAARRQMASSHERLTSVVAAAAVDEAGAFELPLAPSRRAAVRAALAAAGADEALLSSAYSWMRKATDDGLDSVVELLREVVHAYAGDAMAGLASATPPGTAAASTSPPGPGDAALAALLAASPGDWDVLLRGGAPAGVAGGAAAAAAAGPGGRPAPGLRAALAARMERVALGVASGSYAQRVMAEYGTELGRRVAAAEAEAEAEAARGQ